MPEIGDTWHPSMPFPETDRERRARKAEEKEANRIKNERRKEAKKQHIPKNKIDAGKELRNAFKGKFGRAPSNVKHMASQGVLPPSEKEIEDDGTIT